MPGLWKYGAWITSALSILCGVLYLWQEFQVTGQVQDGVFIGALLANTVIASLFGAYLHSRSVPIFRVLTLTDEKTSAPQIIFGSPLLMVTGAGFAAIISGWALVRAPWDNPELNELLAGFLFV